MALPMHHARVLTLCQLAAIVLLTASFDTTTVQAAPVCNRSHPLVGFQGALSSKEHGVGGLITIVDDCNFVAQNFSYDGKVRSLSMNDIESKRRS